MREWWASYRAESTTWNEQATVRVEAAVVAWAVDDVGVVLTVALTACGTPRPMAVEEPSSPAAAGDRVRRSPARGMDAQGRVDRHGAVRKRDLSPPLKHTGVQFLPQQLGYHGDPRLYLILRQGLNRC
jgi:hypothetical protein